ncbi:MAG: MoxR family ATPase [Myxococcota bacterium]|nr:MoxR family ATPase [Myxococcota bacterium]
MKHKELSAVEKICRQELNYRDALSCIETALSQKISVLLRGHPGVGKSALAKDLAQRMNLPLIDIRLAQKDPSEIAGVYFPDQENLQLKLLVPEWIQQAARKPVFIFLDEINAGITKLHQSAAYQLILDRKLGETELHPDTVVMAAGNLPEDQSFVTPLAQALCNRFIHFTLGVDPDEWLKWALTHEIDPAIINYIAEKGEKALYCNDGKAAFPSPRSWSRASQLLGSCPPQQRISLLRACVGTTATTHFLEYERLKRAFCPKAILEKGEGIDFSVAPKNEPSFIYAAVSSLSDYLRTNGSPKEHVVKNLVNFIKSSNIDPEYILIFLKSVERVPRLIPRMKKYQDYRDIAGNLSKLALPSGVA